MIGWTKIHRTVLTGTSKLFSTKRMIDLRSDTVTKPTTVMRKLMMEAEVGDDVYGEDPTVKILEDKIAALFGKQRALFFPSGTMSNLVGVLAWCQKRGSEVILGDKSHIHIYEQGGVSQFGGVSQHVLPNYDDGSFDLEKVESNVRPKDFFSTSTDLVAIENTHNECGGRIVPQEFVQKLSLFCKSQGIPLHLDGARIWNAAVATGLDLAKIVEPVDSVSVCLSKGLGAPIGSVLAGSDEYISAALRMRKALGGGMRQVGIVAAAAIQSLEDFNNGVLQEDHRRTKLLASGLAKIPGIVVNVDKVETNIIMAKFNLKGLDSYFLTNKLQEHGILALRRGNNMIRMVVHRDITDDDILETILGFQKTLLPLSKY